MAGTTPPSVTIVGLGRMGSALLEGLCAAGWPAGSLWAVEPSPEARAARSRRGVDVRDVGEARPASDVVVLAVKPRDVEAALRALSPASWPERTLLLSLAAGVGTARLAALWGGGRPVVRAMPNLAATIGRATTALYAPPTTGEGPRAWASRLLEAVGRVDWCAREEDLDAVTALSGSGIAYILLLIEAMIAEGVSLGLDPGLARALVAGTVEATPALLEREGASPAELRARVASPGGTTEAALAVLARGGFETLVREAVRAAWARSRALGEPEARG